MVKKDFSNKIEEFRHKSNQEKLTFLNSFWEFNIQNEPFKLIGTYEKADKPDKNGKEYGFFINVRNLNGDILYYPFNLGQVRIWVEHKEILFKQDFWLFDVKLNEKKDIKNPFQLNLANKVFGNPKNIFLDRIEKEKLIRKIFVETGYTQRDAKNLSNALKRIAGDLYTETERFIFELLQNADDIPNEKGEVEVKFNLLLENLLFLHNGKPFDNNDVESISSIGDSTKRKDAEKTGYKGIGFKSVFTDAETVLIRSGNFSFSFDKYSPLYSTLYENQNIEEIPWEIKPIWTEKYRYPKEVKNNNDFFEYPVAIDLEVGNEKISSYRKQISQLFSEPRFILFLRHIKSIEVQGLDSNIKIQKKKKNERFELLNNENPIDEWCIDDFDFSVSQETRDAMANDKVVPEKLKEIQKSKLSFACQLNNNEIISIPSDKSFLFTYLPTNVNDYSFPFLVNADFLTTANRQDIHKKNSWNLFLFERIGYLCFEWISKFAQTSELRNSITNLIPNYYENSNELVHLHFNKGYDKAINEIAFLPANNPLLTKVSDAIVDMTGFSYVIGEKLFHETQFAQKNLIINELQNKESLSKLAGITIFDKQKLKTIIANNRFGELTDIKELLGILHRNKELSIDSCDIRDIVENANLESINNWIETCDKETYNVFLKELEESYLRKETKERICQIKLFKFSDGKFYSFNEIVKRQIIQNRATFNYSYSNVFFKTSKNEGITNELYNLGIILSEINTSDYPNIFSSIERMPDEKQMYTFIAEKCKTNTLVAKEKEKLFLNLINEATKFDNVAEGTLKDLQLFCDSNSEIKPLNQLISNIKTPSWLNAYKIKQEEYFSELNSFLISEQEDIFKEIYQQYQDDIIAELTTVEEIKSLINLYQDNQKYFFKEFIIRKENIEFVIDKKTKETYQVQSADKGARKFIDENCADNLFVLPYEFVEKYKDEEGIIKADDLHSLILEFVDVDEHKEILVDIVKYKAKHKFLQELSEFRFNSETEYTKEDYEYKILDLACSELKENDYQKFRDIVIIETDEQDLKLSEIPPFTDKIKIDDYELSLAKILPNNYENSDHLSGLINQFIGLGLNKERIGNLFGVSEEPEPSEIFQMFSEQVETLKNAEQLAFLFLYGLYIEEINFNQFKALNVDEEDIELGTDKYLTEFDFIKQSEILHQKYSGITKIFKEFPIKVEDNDNLLLIKEPYFEDDKFVCPYIKDDLSDEEKLSLVEFLFNQWNKKNWKTAIKNIVWSKIDDTETENILGFNPVTTVYPNKFACEREALPDYLIKWIGKEENKIDFLADLGVWTENSVLVELRKYFNSKIIDFQNNRLAQEKHFNVDETVLFNSFAWLKENEIEIKTAEQFETFKKVVEVINDNRTNNGNLEIQEKFDFEELEENSTEWEESYYENWREESRVSIFLYEGELPKSISLDEIEDYVFYYFNEGNTAIDDKNNIYINQNADVKKELRKLELANDDFDFDGLWQNKLEVLEKENAQLRRTNEATIGTEFSTDISKNDQKEANREAKEIVKEKLEREEFEFTEGIGKYSTIDGVFKDDIEYPLVVKSYKYQDEPLKIGANEWIQLMRPNSMFWVHFGNRKLGCLKLYELLRNQDKLSISFSTENLDVEDRLEKFAELLHYFGNVHFDFNSIKPSDYSVAKDLSDYRFDERRNEEDLSGDNENLL
jgi:hypothetical protein